MVIFQVEMTQFSYKRNHNIYIPNENKTTCKSVVIPIYVLVALNKCIYPSWRKIECGNALETKWLVVHNLIVKVYFLSFVLVLP